MDMKKQDTEDKDKENQSNLVSLLACFSEWRGLRKETLQLFLPLQSYSCNLVVCERSLIEN